MGAQVTVPLSIGINVAGHEGFTILGVQKGSGLMVMNDADAEGGVGLLVVGAEGDGAMVILDAAAKAELISRLR